MSHVFGIKVGRWPLLVAILASVLWSGPVRADDASETAATAAPADEAKAAEGETSVEDPTAEEQLAYSFNNMMLFLAAVLVLFMQAGFAMLEVGLNEAKNTVNILCKNLMDLCVGVLLFFVVGYGLMYPGTYFDADANDGAGGVSANAEWNGYLGYAGMPKLEESSADDVKSGGLNGQVDWLFQVAFAATAATIVSGAVAGRMKFSAYLIYTAVITALVYPICGSWAWGGGWLKAMGFHDFAGSGLVHAVGGFAGLAGAILLGPRIGRYASDGKSLPILGHNMTFATLGAFILLIGWYGFNPGSQLAFASSADSFAVVKIAVNTTLAAAAGGTVALIVAWLLFGKPDHSMALNGMLAGLVGITANCDCVTNFSAIAIGGIAGVLVVLAVLLLDKLRIDDPVGAWPVHGVCGIWGCVAAGLFGGKDLGVQITGSIVIAAWAFGTMLILFSVLKAVNLLRVSIDDEQSGLDISEHGMHAYGKPAA